MFAFGVPVPGTTNAVAAPSAKAAVNADMTPRTAVANTEMTTRTRARADLRMCQLSHSSGATVGGTGNLPGQSSAVLSDSPGTVRRKSREWIRRFRSRPEGDPMQYLALLHTAESNRAPDPETLAAEMAAYEAFHAKAGSAIRAGDALTPTADGVRITGGPDAPTV